MTLADLERRLARIEAGRSASPPTALLSDRPIGDFAADREAGTALANWRAWVAQGRASVRHGVLCFADPVMTEREWIDRHVTAH